MIDQAMICGRMMFFEGISRKILDMPTVGIVGSRNCTEQGEHIAAAIASAFVRAGFVIVSGLASGIDAAAHRAAIYAGGLTIAVLGTPIDKIYPNPALAREIVKSGGLLCSEYDKPVYTKPEAGERYKARDQIIVDLSEAIIPVQAEKHSGTLVTARYAARQKKLLAIPLPTAADQQKHPDRYAGIEELIQNYIGQPHCISFRGRDDYQKIISIIERSRID